MVESVPLGAFEVERVYHFMSTCDLIPVEDLWARRCFNIASANFEPICTVVWCGFRIAAPFGKFDCRINQVEEVALRALYFFKAALLLLPSIPLAAISQLFRCAAWALQSKGYTHVRGDCNVTEKKFTDTGRVKIMTFNIAAVPAGLSYPLAGVPHWRLRIDEIIRKIKIENPDVLVIQEAYDAAVQEEIVLRLKTLYPHFFLHLGIGRFGGLGPGGVFLATKGAVACFSDHPFHNNPPTQCRSFGVLELLDQPGGKPFARFIGTHPAWREEEKKQRDEQWSQIRQYIQERNDLCTLPTVIAADTNAERDQEEGKKMAEWVQFYYKDTAPTCWHQLPMEWKEDDRFKTFGNHRPRQIDNIMLVRSQDDRVHCISSYRIESYQDIYSKECNNPAKLYDTKTAISDHHAVVAELEFTQQ